uniref:Uncharacterized protein n=1 Tax=Utricularia reniformis TaxID=192314 RepID=A0A1Y0B253_9LAMI|nr:hypothetical protein AEK19_MT1242 [Utricularia reniformis]ART31453.1 hypothetical protein AEK19_MT1242 [Utricularia reniformis]
MLRPVIRSFVQAPFVKPVSLLGMNYFSSCRGGKEGINYHFTNRYSSSIEESLVPGKGVSLPTWPEVDYLTISFHLIR